MAPSLPWLQRLASALNSDHRGIARGPRLPQFFPLSLQTVQDLEIDLDVEEPSISQAKLLKAVREFSGYIQANTGRVPNYGERYRAGETISTAFVESAVNQVVSKRMVKKQQMRWTPRGAHLLLQLRTRVLNDDLANDFHRWYPNFTHTTDHQKLTA
jgi:hypothetical protein